MKENRIFPYILSIALTGLFFGFFLFSFFIRRFENPFILTLIPFGIISLILTDSETTQREFCKGIFK